MGNNNGNGIEDDFDEELYMKERNESLERLKTYLEDDEDTESTITISEKYFDKLQLVEDIFGWFMVQNYIPKIEIDEELILIGPMAVKIMYDSESKRWKVEV